MPKKLKKIFEKEYMKKGKTKKEADSIFYGYLSKKKKNKRGQTLGMAIIISIVVFIIGFMVLNFIRPEVQRTVDVDHLDCDNSSISDGTKITCLAVDAAVPYFILAVLSISIGTITARFIL